LLNINNVQWIGPQLTTKQVFLDARADFNEVTIMLTTELRLNTTVQPKTVL